MLRNDVERELIARLERASGDPRQLRDQLLDVVKHIGARRLEGDDMPTGSLVGAIERACARTKPSPIPTDSGVSYRLARPEELGLLVTLGLEAFGEDGPRAYGDSRAQYFAKLYEHDPSIFWLVSRQGAQVGYISVIPLSASGREHYLGGSLSQFQFEPEHLQKVPRAPSALYVQAFYIRKEFRPKLSPHALLATFHAIARRTRGEERVPLLCAEATSPAGLRLLSGLGWRSDSESKDRHPQFVCDFEARPAYTLEAAMNAFQRFALATFQ